MDEQPCHDCGNMVLDVSFPGDHKKECYHAQLEPERRTLAEWAEWFDGQDQADAIKKVRVCPRRACLKQTPGYLLRRIIEAMPGGET